jgi:CRISPR/Cas system CMR-associated protein Cmr5 small subunit
MRNLDQVRAERALAGVAGASDKANELFKKLPHMLRVNGLLATWMFLLDKKEHGAHVLIPLLSHLRAEYTCNVPDGDSAAVFATWVSDQHGLSAAKLQRLTAEAIEMAGWLKRAVEIEVGL